MKRLLELSLKQARRVVVGVIGATVVLIGVVGIFLPILPGFVLIPLGLAILATEFVWARRVLKNLKQRATSMADNLRGRAEVGRSDAPHP